MDKGLKIQVELERRGEKIVLKLKEDFATISEDDKLLYLLANQIGINITKERIGIGVIIEENGEEKFFTITNIKNPFEKMIIAKEALSYYLIRNNYDYSVKTKIINKQVVNNFRIIPPIQFEE